MFFYGELREYNIMSFLEIRLMNHYILGARLEKVLIDEKNLNSN